MGANGSLRSLSHCDDTAVSGQQTTDRTAEAASNWSSWSTHSFADNVDAPLVLRVDNPRRLRRPGDLGQLLWLVMITGDSARVNCITPSSTGLRKSFLSAA